MKKRFPFLPTSCIVPLLLFFLSFNSLAQTVRKQDIIVMRNTSRLSVLIQEVDENVVKYKKPTDPDGPLFTIRKSEIASIEYGNGEVETFEAVLEVPGYFTPAQPQQTDSRPAVSAMPAPRNKLEEDIRSSDPDRLRAIFKYYKTKSKAGMAMGIAGTSAGILVAGIGTGMVAGALDANGNFATYQDERRGITGAWMMIGGFAGAVTFGTVGFIKAGKNGSKASKVKRELVRRHEPLTMQLNPGFNPATRAAYLGLHVTF